MVPSELVDGHLHTFNSWPVTAVPKGPPGVYAIWKGIEFLYVGISWREPTLTSSGMSRGLWGRLDSHASGRRSGDQFCIYVCDRFVLGELTNEQIQEITAGRGSLDSLTRDFIRSHLSYRFVNTSTGAQARAIEAEIRRNGLNGHGRPLLNPLNN